MIVYSPLAQGVLSNKYAGWRKPEGSRATSKFAHFLEAEKALTPENVAAAERFAAWVAQSTARARRRRSRWRGCCTHDVVSSAIIGATRVEQLEENLKASELKLSNADWKAAEAAIKGPVRAAKKPAKAREEEGVA